jgi:two-component system sensor histidine kinase UhpB
MAEELRLGSEILAHMVESVHLVRADDGVIVYTNERFDSMFGYDPHELVGKHVSIINAPGEKSPEAVANEIIHSLKQAGVWSGEVHNIRKDGRSFWCYANVSTFKHPQYGEVWISVNRDITDRKRAESQREAALETLRESEEQYRNLFENANEAIFVGQDGKLVFSNPMTAMLFGYSREELALRPFVDFLHPEDRNMTIDRHFRRMKGEDIPSRSSFRIIHKDGNVKWVELNAIFITWKGKPATLNFISDITERKCSEEELRTSHLQLRALAVRLQQIREEERAIIAREIHDEMGGGLTGLKMDLSWLLRKMGAANQSEERANLIDKIHTSNALIDQMIRAVRRISTDLRPSVLDDLGLIAALEWQLSEFTSRTEIPHEFTTTCEYINMEKDTAIAVFRIFQEALTNVVRHSRATKVGVVLRESERSLFGDECLVLEIRDNGGGITKEEIMNPESLGLLGMKERVLAFGGELSINGEPDGGTALILKIPLIQGEES